MRVQYRAVRRELIRHIILNKLTKTKLDDYIQSEIKRVIPAADQQQVSEDLREDLAEMAPQRIAGLGVTPAQLADWLTAQKKS